MLIRILVVCIIVLLFLSSICGIVAVQVSDHCMAGLRNFLDEHNRDVLYQELYQGYYLTDYMKDGGVWVSLFLDIQILLLCLSIAVIVGWFFMWLRKFRRKHQNTID
jgi:hypothetical protein